MKAKDTGGPAFPSEQHETKNGEWNQSYEQGMTLREYFAAKAMASILADSDMINAFGSREKIAAASYDMANAMLREREK